MLMHCKLLKAWVLLSSNR